MLINIRLYSQQLTEPTFDTPKEIVSWMGAIQAQNYNMAKWAIGIRLKHVTDNIIEKAFQQGEILRMHILRPTWHFIIAEDIHWMLKLSAQRIRSANESFGKNLEITEKLYTKCNRLIEKHLTGNNHLTKQEIGDILKKENIKTDIPRLNRFLIRAETEKIICSGINKGNKQTYALLNERVSPAKEITKDEALAKLANKYFQSHSPATLEDFTWWSGLSVTEARQAIDYINSSLLKEQLDNQKEIFIHESYSNKNLPQKNILHFLPSFDEYLISYKDRSEVLNEKYRAMAFNNYGTFYPVILYNGKISGNWKLLRNESGITIKTSFFEKTTSINQHLIENAEKRYKQFIDSFSTT